jgi:hypothetical protein
MSTLKFKKDFRNLPLPSKQEPNHIQQGLEKLQARRGEVPAYDQKQDRPRDLNGQLIKQGGKYKTKKRSYNKRKTQRKR